MNVIVLLLYATGYAFAWRKAFIVCIDEVSWGGIEPIDVIMAAIFATLSAIIWPLWLVPIALYHLLVKKQLEAWIERRA